MGVVDPVEAAQQERDAAQQRRDALKVEWRAAVEEAARQQFRRQGRTLYAPGAVIVEDERVASLRKQLDAAQVAYSTAEAAYLKAYNLELVRPGR
jgi:hypothetical protein